MELEDAIHTAILTLKEGFEGAVDEKNIGIVAVGIDVDRIGAGDGVEVRAGAVDASEPRAPPTGLSLRNSSAGWSPPAR